MTLVRDHNGQELARIYYENELRPAVSGNLLTKDDARRIAADFANTRPPLPAAVV
jgi:hypothetical protein